MALRPAEQGATGSLYARHSCTANTRMEAFSLNRAVAATLRSFTMPEPDGSMAPSPTESDRGSRVPVIGLARQCARNVVTTSRVPQRGAAS